MKPPINEHDEFLLSRLLDNDLPPAEAEALRRRIENEPALSEACAAMTRLDGLLKGRRADQPQVDWKSFHARVTNQVERAAETGASSPIIRLSRWLAVGVPLAAAASIALVLMLRTPGDKRVIGPPPGSIQPAAPVAAQPGNLSVAVRRPTSPAPKSKGEIKIDFPRSQHLAEAIWQADAIEDEKAPMGLAGGPSAAPEAAPRDEEMDNLVEVPPM